MRRTVFTGRRGLAPVLLTVVIVWALAAVLMLTGTLLAARSIKQDVGVITPVVDDINGDTKNVELALKVKKVTDDILESLTPLSGELQATLKTAKGINTTAKSILRRVRTINGTAMSINGTVQEIGTSVNSISGNAGDILSNARAINSNARDINDSVLGINGSATSVSTSVRSIFQRAGGILETARSVEDEVGGINSRAERARRVAIPIKADLDQVLGLVGNINGHANSIDCSNLLQGSACDRGQARRSDYGSPRTIASLLGAIGNEKGVKTRRAHTRRARDQDRGASAPAPSADKPATPESSARPTAPEAIKTIKSEVDKVFGLVPGINLRTDSLTCNKLLNGSRCNR